MMYLITQMLLCIAFALVTGGAIGWLVHRAKHSERVAELRQTIGKQHAQVQQARTDVAMITQDFDDLKTRAQTEIDTLRQDNKRLPSLLTNLEKSQSLVRQLMQKHEAQLRDLTQDNERLRSEVASLNERESAFRKVRAELDSARARLVTLDPASEPPRTKSTAVPAVGQAKAKAAPREELRRSPVASDELSTVATPTPSRTLNTTSHSAPASQELSRDVSPSGEVASAAPAQAVRSSWASAPAPDIALSVADKSVAPESAPAEPAPAESDSAALMRSMGLDFTTDDELNELDEASDAMDASELTVEGTGSGADRPSADSDSQLEHDEQEAARDHTDQDGLAGDTIDSDGPQSDKPEYDAVEAEGDLDAQVVGEVLFDDDGDDNDDDADSLLGYDDADVEQLFDTVDRRDDLKQIFGIGPVTEKALNDLGITSYSQLADLKRHDIETIADALQIFPGRIERDDWVGNARRQLEDVLEEL